MGCENCKCMKKIEQNNEMLYGASPQDPRKPDLALLESRNKIDINCITEQNLKNSDVNPDIYHSLSINNAATANNNTKFKTTEDAKKIQEENDSLSSNFLSVSQDRSESLFDYFNEIRFSPENFEREAEDHGVSDLIQKAKNKNDKPTNLIKNPYFNLMLETYITQKRLNTNDDELNKELENDKQISEYEKDLYIIEASNNNPTEAVWNLLEENKHKNGFEILSDTIDYLVISNIPVLGTQNFRAYFLFLKKKD